MDLSSSQVIKDDSESDSYEEICEHWFDEQTRSKTISKKLIDTQRLHYVMNGAILRWQSNLQRQLNGDDGMPRSFFIALDFEELHLTVALRQDCCIEEFHLMQSLCFVIGQMLPIRVKCAGIKMIGYKMDVKAMLVQFCDEHQGERLKDLYRDTYRQKEGWTPHPELMAHVSVDRPEREACLEKILEREAADIIFTSVSMKEIVPESVRKNPKLVGVIKSKTYCTVNI
jgi:hypothetical protein